jgi:hypothetical protein
VNGMLYGPGGGVLTGERQEIAWPPDFMRMLAIFARNCTDTGLGIRCERCKEPLNGSNADSDHEWTMECACRTYRGRNPLARALRRRES